MQREINEKRQELLARESQLKEMYVITQTLDHELSLANTALSITPSTQTPSKQERKGKKKNQIAQEKKKNPFMHMQWYPESKGLG